MPDILIVDDDADIRGLLVFTLEDSGFSVREAKDGASAILALQESPPDCVVLDVMMPGVDGFGVLRTRRRLGLAPDARVLMLTAKTSERDFLQGWELGADDYVTKPFDPDDLIKSVRQVLAADPRALSRRRDAELGKAALLERVESAFTRLPQTPR